VTAKEPPRSLEDLRGTADRMIANRLTGDRGTDRRGGDGRLAVAPPRSPGARAPALQIVSPVSVPPLGKIIAHRVATLEQRIKDHIAQRGSSQVSTLTSLITRPGDTLVIGSNHQLVNETCALEEKLVATGAFDYYGSEEFVQGHKRENELKKVLDGGSWRKAPKWLRPFESLLTTARSKRVKILRIGYAKGKDRDKQLASNVISQLAKHQGNGTAAVNGTVLLSLGAAHASRLPVNDESQSPRDIVRNRLARAGLRVKSAYLVSDRVIVASNPGQPLIELRADLAVRIHYQAAPLSLLDLMPSGGRMMIVPMSKRSPFDEITYFPSLNAFGQCFEFMVFRREVT
jgi:hypothetical protein